MRFISPEPVDGRIMFIVASLGLGVNLVLMQILHSGAGGHHGHSHGGESDHGPAHGGNINVRAAFIHALGDMLQSIGVMIAAAIIWAVPDARAADPACTLLFSVLVLGTTIGIVRQGFAALLNTVPDHIDLGQVCDAPQHRCVCRGESQELPQTNLFFPARSSPGGFGAAAYPGSQQRA